MTPSDYMAMVSAVSYTMNSVDNNTVAVKCELLYFVMNKCNALHFDAIVNICADFYTVQEVESARVLLAEYSKKRLALHKGTDVEKSRRTMKDIVRICLNPDVQLPVFYSVDMTRVPPVGIEHVDVSSLLQEVSSLRAEVRSLTAVRAEVADIAISVKAMQTAVLGTGIPAVRHQQHDNDRLKKGNITNRNGLIPAVEADTDPKSLLIEAPVTTAVQQAMVPPPAAAVGAQTFATLARDLQGIGMAKKQSRKSPSPVVGQSSSNLRLKSVLTKRSIDIFISRLQPETDVDEVIACARDVLGNDDLHDVACVKLKSKHADLYSSFYVSIKVDVAEMKRHINLLMASESWPSGILVRRYFKPKNGE
jgi:hypothetical protein